MPAKVMVVFGTRPEAIKMAPVVQALGERQDRFEVVTCLTAQHREMLDQVMDLFGLRADHDLDIMTHGQDLYDVTARVLLGMREVIRAERPAALLVHGDTTTSAAAALAAFYEQVPVGHVEAGLRSGLRYSPFPEEMNRVLTGRLASIHFCPTRTSLANLQAEGLGDGRAFVTGNTAIDALLRTVADPALARIEPTFTPGRRGVLVTAHRRENFGQGIRDICGALLDLARAHPDIEIVYPVHRNPNILGPVNELLGGQERIRLLEPVDYHRFVRMMHDAHLILTDSGGVQEEAPGLGKPVLVLRACTERPEAVTAGTVQLVGTDRAAVVAAAGELLGDAGRYEAMAKAVNPYGDGRAAARIAGHLHNLLNLPADAPEPVGEFSPEA